MYKQLEYNNVIDSILLVELNAFIPFDPANSDYQQFKIDVANGTPLEDPDGNVMTQAEVDAFLHTIP